MSLNPRSFFIRPIHRSNIERCVLIELGYSFPRQPYPFLRGDRRLEEQFLCGIIDPGAVKIKIGRDPFKRTGSVEYHRTKPGGVGAGTHDPNIPLLPTALEECPRL